MQKVFTPVVPNLQHLHCPKTCCTCLCDIGDIVARREHCSEKNFESIQAFIFSWNGNEYKLIKNSTDNTLLTTFEHLNGGLARYDNRPIAISGDNNLETEIYNPETQEWETKTEWKLQLIRQTYNGSVRLRVFPIISFEKYVLVFGGRWGNQFQKSNKIGLILQGSCVLKEILGKMGRFGGFKAAGVLIKYF